MTFTLSASPTQRAHAPAQGAPVSVVYMSRNKQSDNPDLNAKVPAFGLGSFLIALGGCFVRIGKQVIG